MIIRNSFRELNVNVVRPHYCTHYCYYCALLIIVDDIIDQYH